MKRNWQVVQSSLTCGRIETTSKILDFVIYFTWKLTKLVKTVTQFRPLAFSRFLNTPICFFFQMTKDRDLKLPVEFFG